MPLPADYTIIAATPLPRPAVGNACVIQGSIREFHTQDPLIVSVGFLLAGETTVFRRTTAGIERLRISPGGFGISPAGIDVAYRTEGWHESLSIAFPDEMFQGFASSQLGHTGPRIELEATMNSRTPEIVSLGLAFSRLVLRPKPGLALYAETLWTQILLQVLWHHSNLRRELIVGEGERLSDGRVATVIAHLENHLDRDVSLSDLAALVDLSPSHFLRAFKRATGRTPHQYRLELRVSRACELLRDPALTITQIAMMLGFSSSSHFTTAFRRHRGTSPTAYRAAIFGS